MDQETSSGTQNPVTLLEYLVRLRQMFYGIDSVDHVHTRIRKRYCRVRCLEKLDSSRISGLPAAQSHGIYIGAKSAKRLVFLKGVKKIALATAKLQHREPHELRKERAVTVDIREAVGEVVFSAVVPESRPRQ